MPDNAIVERVYNAYLECALWSSHGDNTGEYLDTLGYSVGDIAEDTLAVMYSDCERFYFDNQELLDNLRDAGLTDCDKIGHDLWLTRNWHGAGFWDRGLGDAGETLTQAAHVMGEFGLYVGDDNRVYGSAG